MRKFGLLGTSALRSAAVFGFAVALTAPALAQETPPNQDPPETLTSEVETESGADAQDSGQGSEELVVTGSRIRRPNLESVIPITSIGGEEFFQQGQTNVGDTLNELPQLRTTFGQQNAGRFLGTTGLNLLDLRGLGTQRTLVLVNGRRHVAADILNNAVSPDVNTIPNDLIERVDIVTGGNSAIYGSDAIAGVVNFILRRDFEGIQVRGQAGISEEGYGGNQYVSAMFGTNFADGRGNITVHGEFAHADRVYGSDISFLRQNNGFLTIDTDVGGLPNGSDGFSDRAFFRDIRSASINPAGIVPFPQPAGGRCGTGITPTNGPPVNTGTPYNCTFIFAPDGTLFEQTGTRVGAGPIGSIVGGNGSTGRERGGLSVLPFQERMNFNLLGRYEFSEAVEAFIEAKYVKVDTQGQQSSPAFIQGGTIGDARERPRLDNPFLPEQSRQLIASQLLASGLNSSLSGRTALTAAQRAQIANGSYRFTVLRFLEDLGFRDEASERQTYRIVGGLRGTFNDDWNYEISANYGKVEEDTTILGNILPQRLALALDAVRNASGQIVCRSQIDPTNALYAFATPGDEAALAQDIANCVPYNPFGFSPGQNAAAADYITEDTVSRAKLEQFVISGFVSGDTSSFFELPGGAVRFALGAEYRREDAFYSADPIVEEGRTFYNALPTFDPPAFEVKEAFAEIQLPILRDTPFFEDLTVSAAGRVADYKGATGTVFAYNAGVEWAPIRDIRFRANYGRSVRAPNYTETAFPLTQNFAPGFADPCLPQNIGRNPNRPGNCRADLGSILDDPGFQSIPGSSSPEILSGSNPDLNEETSDSITVGAVIQPRFVPGLSLTVDYFDIKVEDVITSISAQTIVNTCYDLPSLDNPFCPLFERNRNPAGGPRGEALGELLERSLTVVPLNFAALKRRGIDFELAYRRSIGEDSRIDTRFIYTHQIQNSNFTNPAIPEFENRILGELGDPQDEFRWDFDLTFGDFTLGYQMQYIGPQVLNLYEDFFELPTACTAAGCPPNDLDYAGIRKYPEVFYHDIRFEWRVRGDQGLRGENDMSFYVGVDNIFDRQPPLGLTGVGGGSGIYNVRGRNYYAGFRARF